ncbi:MAG: hypothetical protein WC657_08460 [Candidatus Paceibacterota bacterium]|jgi:hypothetical protein
MPINDEQFEVFTWVDPQGLCYLLLPIVADIDPKYRHAVGEFLHRLNIHEVRKLWEFDFNTGDVRLTAYTDGGKNRTQHQVLAES